MFTGIVQEVGRVERITRKPRSAVALMVRAPKTAAKVKASESVSINGVCLTVVAKRGSRVTFQIIAETLKRTNLAALSPGSRVNCEPGLSLSSRFNGHIVLGHVDGTASVIRRKQQGGELTLTLRFARSFRPLLVPKGSITLEGVSLTLGKAIGPNFFTVHLIPETLKATTLGFCRVGDKLNLELDYIAKLVASSIKLR